VGWTDNPLFFPFGICSLAEPVVLDVSEVDAGS
jgi:hypothetical protein